MILVIWKFDSSSMNFNITRLENFHKKMKAWTPGGSTPDKFTTYAWSAPAHLMRCIWSELIIALEWNSFWWVTIKGAHWLTFLTETCTMKNGFYSIWELPMLKMCSTLDLTRVRVKSYLLSHCWRWECKFFQTENCWPCLGLAARIGSKRRGFIFTFAKLVPGCRQKKKNDIVLIVMWKEEV